MSLHIAATKIAQASIASGIEATFTAPNGASPSMADPLLFVSATVTNGTTMLGILGALTLLLLLLITRILSFTKRLAPAPAPDMSTSKGRIEAASMPAAPHISSFLLHLWYFALVAGCAYLVWTRWDNPLTIEDFRKEYQIAWPGESELMKTILSGKIPTSGESNIVIPIQDADFFLQNNVAFFTRKSPLEQFALVRKAIAVSATDESHILAEELRLFNHPILIEYEIPTTTAASGMVRMRITANGYPIPGLLADYLWNSLTGAIASGYQDIPLAKTMKYVRIQKDGVLFHAK